MPRTVTVRLTPELGKWLDGTAEKTGMPVDEIVRDALERARRAKPDFMRHAGSFNKLAGQEPRTA